jgi:hypothetical protein
MRVVEHVVSISLQFKPVCSLLLFKNECRLFFTLLFPRILFWISFTLQTHIYNWLRGLSPRANYTDRATATSRRSWCQLFADRGCHVVSVTDPYGRILGFLNRSRSFSSKQLLNCTHKAEWTPFQTHYFSKNLVAPGIEAGPLHLWPGTLSTRPQRRSTVIECLRLALSKWPNRVGVSLLSPEDGNRSTLRSIVFSSIKIPDDGQGPETQWFWVVYTIVISLQVLFLSCIVYILFFI